MRLKVTGNKTLIIVYNTLLGLSLKMALQEEPKHVAVINDIVIIFYNYLLLNKKLCQTVQLCIFC
jgi:hypothetical protein